MLSYQWKGLVLMKEESKRNPLNNFEAQFKKATLQLLILSILSDGEMYAYEIAQTILEKSNGKYKAPLLYTSISKLEESGFVSESKKETVANRLKTYHEQTQPLIEFYENEGVLVTVDGTKKPSEVLEDILGALK